MKYDYQRTFDAVNMPQEHQERIRSVLTDHVAATQGTNIIMSRKKKPVRLLAVAALVTLLLAFAGFTFGDQIIRLLGGGTFEHSEGNWGNSTVSMSSGFETDPVEVKDSQVYFMLDGSSRNITAQCTEETYYQYETIDANGNRHVVLVGGTPENIGWAEFLWTKGGKFAGSNATHLEGEEPAWLRTARATLTD